MSKTQYRLWRATKQNKKATKGTVVVVEDGYTLEGSGWWEPIDLSQIVPPEPDRQAGEPATGAENAGTATSGRSAGVGEAPAKTPHDFGEGLSDKVNGMARVFAIEHNLSVHTVRQFVRKLIAAAPVTSEQPGPLSVEEARAKGVCRYCRRADNPVTSLCWDVGGVPKMSHAICEAEWEAREQATDAERQLATLFAAVKKHHDQKADDRCWMDDQELYQVAGLSLLNRHVGDKEAMLKNCERFINQRCAGGVWPSYVELEAKIKKLQEFKDYVHQRFNEAGIPADDPNNEHSKQGCRVGARFDMLLAREAKWREAAERFACLVNRPLNPQGTTLLDTIRPRKFGALDGLVELRVGQLAEACAAVESLLAGEGGARV